MNILDNALPVRVKCQSNFEEGELMKPLVLQSDFGHSDGAVAAMYGVAQSVSPELKVFDLTHDIPQYDIWEASYRLIQAIEYWPEGTVFVSVVDPGVGSSRKSIAVRTSGGRYIITPDNGTLTHLKRKGAIKETRVIDEDKNRLPRSGESYTFHGRDIFAYTGARLAGGEIGFEDIGPVIAADEIIELPVIDSVVDNDCAKGTIDVLDVRFGSLWTNIDREKFESIGVKYGGRVEVTITNSKRVLYKNIISYAKSFADVNVGEPLVYINSLNNVAVAINQGSFSKAYNIGTGIEWQISLRKAPKIVYE